MEDTVLLARTWWVMSSAPVETAIEEPRVVPDHHWNWGLIVVLAACLVFWLAVIVGVTVLV